MRYGVFRISRYGNQHLGTFQNGNDAHGQASTYARHHNTRTMVVDLHSYNGNQTHYDSDGALNKKMKINEKNYIGSVDPYKSWTPENHLEAIKQYQDKLVGKNRLAYAGEYGDILKKADENRLKFHQDRYAKLTGKSLSEATLDEAIKWHRVFKPSKKIDMSGTDSWSPEKHEAEADYLNMLARNHADNGNVNWAARHATEAGEHKKEARRKSRMRSVNENLEPYANWTPKNHLDHAQKISDHWHSLPANKRPPWNSSAWGDRYHLHLHMAYAKKRDLG